MRSPTVAHVNWTHTEAVAAVLAVFQVHRDGGALRSVLDGGPLDDEALRRCAAQLRTPVERSCWRALQVLSETERHMVMAMAEAAMQEGHE